MAEETKIVSIGGQAVMEGVMMQGPEHWCLAVRTPDGKITTERHETKRRFWAKWPLLRGVFSFISSMIMGYGTLMRSAELSMGDEYYEEEPSKVDAWIEKTFGDKAGKIIMALSMVLGVGLALGLFIVLPTLLVGFLGRFMVVGTQLRSLLEGVLKVMIFVAYLLLVRNMNEIRRTFCYHGAEHKTIACYEAGLDLTVENVRPQTRYHARCSTSFIFIVLVISIFVNSLIPATGTVLRVVLKLLLLPLVMGISFEILRFTGKYDNWLTRILAQPGKWMQRITTSEPDDQMIEVAIAAAKPVLPGWVEPLPTPEEEEEAEDAPLLQDIPVEVPEQALPATPVAAGEQA